MPNSDGLRLYWADAQLDSAQLSEPRWLPGAVDSGLVPALLPAADDPTAPAAVDPALPMAVDPAPPAAVDPAAPVADDPAAPAPVAADPAAVGEECSETVSVNVLDPSPVESADLGEESSGSYLLCFSCSFLLLISASLSTLCNSLAWQ